jgi:signal transduction histidine kinase
MDAPAAARSSDVGEVPVEALARRIGLVLWIVVVGNLLFAATDPWLNPGVVRELSLVKLCLITVQLAGLAVLSRRPTRRGAVTVAMICGAVASAGGTIAGIIVNDPFTTPLLCMSGALLTAAVVPWGSVNQLGLALINLVAAAVLVYLLVGMPMARPPIVGMIVIAGLSVYIAHELDRQRSAEMRATLTLQRHQAELAHVLRVSAMGEMAAQLAHELTQPLGAIANYAAGCRRRMGAAAAGGGVDRGRGQDRARGAARRRDHPPAAGVPAQGGARRAPVDVNALVHEVADLVEGEARERGVAVDLTLQPDLPAVEGDDVEIEQVLINLARNALEAMLDNPGDTPTLTVETRLSDPQTVEVVVRDTGPGLPDGDAAIFEPFHTTKPRGLGMGLAICRTIVEAHGGQLAAASNPTRGATFRFTLPATPTARAARGAHAEERSSRSA